MFYDRYNNVVEILLGVSCGPKMEDWFAFVVTAMTIHTPVERLFCFANVLHTTSALEKVYGVFGFASHVAKNGKFFSSAVAFKRLSMQYLGKGFTYFIFTWLTLARYILSGMT